MVTARYALTVQVCVFEAPSALVAVTVKLLGGVSSSTAEGLHVSVLTLIEAVAGPAVSE